MICAARFLVLGKNKILVSGLGHVMIEKKMQRGFLCI
jgi:hypothetical protein